MSRRALTGNAADRRQVEYAERRERRRAAMFAQALQATLQTAEGRALLWCLIEKAGVFRSVWENSARIHYNAGRQDYGHELLADILETDPQHYLLMEREARQRLAVETREIEAMQDDPRDETFA